MGTEGALPSRGWRPPRALAGLVVAAVLGACAAGPDFHRPEGPTGPTILDQQRPMGALVADGHGQSFDARSDVPLRWWTSLGSPVLDRLVDDAVDGSASLQAARANLRQSEDELRAGYGIFLPEVAASASAQRQSTVVNLGHGPVATGAYTVGTLGAGISFVPDLFGGQRRAVEALGAHADAQRFALLAAQLTLTTSVVDTAVARAAYLDQQAAIRALIDHEDTQIRLARAQVEAGTVPFAAVLALQAQRSGNAATAAALEQRADQAGHLLARLSGKAPADFAPPALHLAMLTLPPQLPDALPASLARHRPDVLAAEAALHQASAQIGVATADLFPSLTLSATGGTSHAAIGQLLRAGTRYWSAQAELAGSIFEGGRSWYTRRAAIDAYDAALAQYQDTVLAALDQVADAMRALEHDAQVLQAQADALDAATQGARLTAVAFEAGTAGYLDVLAADAQTIQARSAYLGAVAQRLQDTVALYAALGGGWWNDTPAQSPGAGHAGPTADR